MKRNMERNRAQTCIVCGEHFESVHYNAQICSDRCRKRKQRNIQRIETLLNSCIVAIDELRDYSGKDGGKKAFEALQRVATRAQNAAGYFESSPWSEPKQLPIPESAYTIENQVDGVTLAVSKIDDLDPDMVAKKFGYDMPHILAYYDARFVTRHGHKWTWGKQTVEKIGTEYYLRPKNIYLGHYMEAVVAMSNFVQTGRDNAAARRAWSVKRTAR